MGALQMKTGEAEAGKSNLLKAYELDPNDPDTLELMKQHGVAAPEKAAASAASARPVQQAAPNGAVPHRNGSNRAAGHVQTPRPPAACAAPAGSGAAGRQQQARRLSRSARPAAAPARVRRRQPVGRLELSELPRRRGKRGGSAQVTIGIIIIAMVGGGGYAWGSTTPTSPRGHP